MGESIVVSVASYRDFDLVNTVRSAFLSASDSSRIFFSVHSQGEDGEHADLSFIPSNQINYIKNHWSESMGACWAREIANRNIDGFDYFLQIDAHCRFDDNWDNDVISMYKKSERYWGEEIVLSTYPPHFEVDPETGEDVYFPEEYVLPAKANVYWDYDQKMLLGRADSIISDLEHGDEVYMVSAASLFTTVDIMKKIPYDGELYFIGEEPSLAIRAFTRGIKIITPSKNYMYANYSPDKPKRKHHWEDFGEWWVNDKKSYERLEKIMTGDKSLGIYGIESEKLFAQYQARVKVCLVAKDFSR